MVNMIVDQVDDADMIVECYAEVRSTRSDGTDFVHAMLRVAAPAENLSIAAGAIKTLSNYFKLHGLRTYAGAHDDALSKKLHDLMRD